MIQALSERSGRVPPFHVSRSKVAARPGSRLFVPEDYLGSWAGAADVRS